MTPISIKKILKTHCKSIKTIDPTINIAKITKQIDKISQETLIELYNLRDERKLVKQNKKGHCC